MNWGKWGRWSMGGLLIGGLLVAVERGQTPGGQAPAAPPVPAAPAKAEPSIPLDKVVLKVGDASITRGEVEALIHSLTPEAQANLSRMGRRPIGDEYIRILLLSQDALNRHLESTPAYQEMLAVKRREVLATLAYQIILRQCEVAPEEVNKYYEDHHSEFETAEVSQVVVRIKPQGAKEGTPGLTQDEAKARAEEIRKAIISGDDMKKLALKYGVANVVRVSSYPEIVHRGDLSEGMEKAAFGLKDGEVSDVFDFGSMLAFIKVGARKMEDLKLVSPRIEHDLRQQKIDSAMDALKKKENVWMDENYFTGSSRPERRQPPPSKILFQGPVTLTPTPK